MRHYEKHLEWQREYYQRPEKKAKMSKQQREYNQRPEVKERRRKQRRERYLRKKKLREEE